MESTPYKNAYDKEIQPDDSVKLTFREARIEDHQVSLSVSLMMVYLLGLLCVWLLLALGLAWALGRQYTGTAEVISLLAVSAGVLLWRRRLLTQRAVIHIKRDGLIMFGRQRLAFKDVVGFGIHTEMPAGQVYVQLMTGRTFAENTYVYALVGGREIRITRHMRKTLAEALVREVEDEAVAWANRDPDPAFRLWDPMLPPRETDANEDEESTVPAKKKRSFLWNGEDNNPGGIRPWDQRYADRNPETESRMEEIDLSKGGPFEFDEEDLRQARHRTRTRDDI